MGGPEPQLLEPVSLGTARSRVQPWLAVLALLAAASGGIVAINGPLWSSAATGSVAALASASASSASGLILPVDPAEPRALATAIAALRLSDAERRVIRAAVGRGELRLGIVAVSDWMHEDGDAVAITAAGFAQEVSIFHEPALIVLPYAPSDPSIVVTGLRDGESGITVAVGPPGQQTRLRALQVGESIAMSLR